MCFLHLFLIKRLIQKYFDINKKKTPSVLPWKTLLRKQPEGISIFLSSYYLTLLQPNVKNLTTPSL